MAADTELREAQATVLLQVVMDKPAMAAVPVPTEPNRVDGETPQQLVVDGDNR